MFVVDEMEKSVENENIQFDVSAGVKCVNTSNVDSPAASEDKAPCREMGGADAVLHSDDGMRPRSHSLISSGVETVMSAPCSAPCTGNMWKRRRLACDGGRSESDSDSTFSERSSQISEPATSKKKRGRPPTTGQYVGYAAAKAAYLKQQRAELEFEVERGVFESSRLAANQRLSAAHSQLGEQPAQAPQEVVASMLEDVRKVAAKSKNLKGTYQKILKNAADSIQSATANLAVRTVNDETARLQADKVRLQAQLDELRRETACLRAELTELAKTRQSSSSTFDVEMEEQPAIFSSASVKRSTKSSSGGRRAAPPVIVDGPAQVDLEALVAEIMRQVGTMINARFEGLEQRLLPAPRIRPPLAADKVTASTSQSATNSQGRAAPPTFVSPQTTTAQEATSVPEAGAAPQTTAVQQTNTATQKDTPRPAVVAAKRGGKNKKKGKKKRRIYVVTHYPAGNRNIEYSSDDSLFNYGCCCIRVGRGGKAKARQKSEHSDGVFCF
jgi:hypothetical protein